MKIVTILTTARLIDQIGYALESNSELPLRLRPKTYIDLISVGQGNFFRHENK